MKTKFTLQRLKVSSFLTAINENELITIGGGIILNNSQTIVSKNENNPVNTAAEKLNFLPPSLAGEQCGI